MKIKHFVVGPIATNCYLAINEQNGELVIIDPGAEAERIAAFIDTNGYQPQAILYTHGHFDHVQAGEALHDRYQIPRLLHRADLPTMGDPGANCAYMIGVSETYEADTLFDDGDEFSYAGFSFRAIHTPGHTVGGACFYMPDEGVLFSGDTLFCESVGRTDFVGGSMSEIVRSIKEKLFALPDATVVYTGHGEPTKISYERLNNPYV